jgi:hypothetical protein
LVGFSFRPRINKQEDQEQDKTKSKIFKMASKGQEMDFQELRHTMNSFADQISWIGSVMRVASIDALKNYYQPERF